MRTAHDVDLGVYRLLSAPRDVFPAAENLSSEIGLAAASEPYKKLFHQYLAEFADVYELVSEIWESDLDELVEAGNSIGEAIQIKLDNCAAGPAEHPNLVWLVRKYWLACAQIGAEDRVPPEVFLLKWMIDEGHREYVQLVSAMPYWPIGLDENGNWC